MQTRARISITVVCLVLAALAVFSFLPKEAAPSSTATLKEWLISLADEPPQPGKPQTVAAREVSQLGTNSIPQLLEWIQFRVPQWRYWLARQVPRGRLRQPTIQYLTMTQRQKLADGSTAAFQVLGARAAAAVIPLTKFLTNHTQPETAFRAEAALAYIGTNSLPAITPIVRDPANPDRLTALKIIWAMPSNPDTDAFTTPLFIECLRDTRDSNTAAIAAMALANKKTNIDLCINELAACLSTNHAIAVKLTAIQALTGYGVRARAAIPALSSMLHQSIEPLRWDSSNAMWHIAPDSLTNTPAK